MPDNSNKMVTVAYVGHFDDGTVFMEQPQDNPIEFPCVDGWMPPEFIETVRTMEVGETREAHVSPEAAYAEHEDSRVMEVPRANIPHPDKVEVGDMINLETPSGQTYPARLVALEGDIARFDMNPDAIAKALNFTITLLAVNEL